MTSSTKTLLSSTLAAVLALATAAPTGAAVSIVSNHAPLFSVMGAPYTARVPNGSLGTHFLRARHFDYVADRPWNRWQYPAETEMLRAGDCEDKALWLYDRLKSSGYANVDFMIGKLTTSRAKLHAWVVYRDASGEAFVLDPSTQRRMWKAADVEGFYKPYVKFNAANPGGVRLTKNSKRSA